jgi:phosphoserine phosphatase
LDPQTHVTANQILFDEQGHYAGFDATEPTSQDMGKPRALQQLQKQFGYQTMVMIGDGATDAQAKPPARAFVGFGGVVVREKVVQASDWFVTDFDDLTYIVQTVGLQK